MSLFSRIAQKCTPKNISTIYVTGIISSPFVGAMVGGGVYATSRPCTNTLDNTINLVEASLAGAGSGMRIGCTWPFILCGAISYYPSKVFLTKFK